MHPNQCMGLVLGSGSGLWEVGNVIAWGHHCVFVTVLLWFLREGCGSHGAADASQFTYKGSTNAYVLKLKKNLYRAKDAGRIWYEHLSRLLVQKHGFTQSSIDECIFYHNGIMLLIFVDNTICLCKNPLDQKLFEAKLKKSFEITIKGTVSDFLGVKFTRWSDGCIELTQPHWLIPFSKTSVLSMTRRRKLATRGPQLKLDAFSEVTSTFHLTTKHGTTILSWASSISWRIQPDQTLPMLHTTSVLAFQVIQELATLMLCSELVLTYLQPDLKDLSFNPRTILLIVGLMQILLVIGLPNVILSMLTVLDQEMVMLFSTQAAQSSGNPSYNEKLFYLPMGVEWLR